MYQCPHCNKTIKRKQNLAPHIAKFHAGAENKPAEGTETLTLEISQEPESQQYHCINCGHTPITRDMAECPKCSTQFEWSAVNG